MGRDQHKGSSKQKKRTKWEAEHRGYTRSSWAKEKREKRLAKRIAKLKKRKKD